MSEIADKLIDNFNTASRDVQKVRSTSNLELFMDAWNSLSGYIEELESRITELSQAVGLITTLKPTMVMDANHPLDMVREVAEHVTARIAELEDFINQLIEVGDELADGREYQDDLVDLWHDVTRGLKEREE